MTSFFLMFIVVGLFALWREVRLVRRDRVFVPPTLRKKKRTRQL